MRVTRSSHSGLELARKMALPNQLRHTMLPTELEFVALEEVVTIVPSVKMDKIRFISVSIYKIYLTVFHYVICN